MKIATPKRIRVSVYDHPELGYKWLTVGGEINSTQMLSDLATEEFNLEGSEEDYLFSWEKLSLEFPRSLSTRNMDTVFKYVALCEEFGDAPVRAFVNQYGAAGTLYSFRDAYLGDDTISVGRKYISMLEDLIRVELRGTGMEGTMTLYTLIHLINPDGVAEKSGFCEADGYWFNPDLI